MILNNKYGLVELGIFGSGEEILIAYGEDLEFSISLEYFKSTYEFIGFI